MQMKESLLQRKYMSTIYKKICIIMQQLIYNNKVQLFIIQEMSYIKYISHIWSIYIIMIKNCCSAYCKWKVYFLNFIYFSLIPSN